MPMSTSSITLRRAAAAVAGCALLLSSTAATAQAVPPPDLFSLFKRVCADNEAVYASTTAAAEVQSWSKFALPIPLPTGGAKLRQKTIRTKGMGKGAVSLFLAGTGEVQAGAKRAPFEMCAIAAKPGDVHGAVRQVQAWIGQPPQLGEKNSRSFRYHRTSAGLRTPLGAGDLRDIAAKLGPGTIVSVDVALQGGAAVISYSTIKL